MRADALFRLEDDQPLTRRSAVQRLRGGQTHDAGANNRNVITQQGGDMIFQSHSAPQSLSELIQAIGMSVSGKSSPVQSNGLPADRAMAYVRQSPKFREALCLPLP